MALLGPWCLGVLAAVVSGGNSRTDFRLGIPRSGRSKPLVSSLCVVVYFTEVYRWRAVLRHHKLCKAVALPYAVWYCACVVQVHSHLTAVVAIDHSCAYVYIMFKG